MMRSFDALALRQLATRRLRAVLTSFGIVLGVGMVFGVLLLVGTIRHTFDDLIDSAWGKTDLIVMGPSGAGLVPDSTLTTIRETDGVRSAQPMIGAIFNRLDDDGRPVNGMAGQILVAGIEPKNAPYDFRYVAGRPVRAGREVVVERNWARARHVELGGRIPVATSTGRASLRVVGIFKFTSGLAFGDSGLAAMPIRDARVLMDMPGGHMQIAVSATDRDQVGALQARLRRELGAGVSVRTPQGVGDEWGEQLGALNVVLYFFSGIALFVGAFLILNSFNMTVLQRMRELGMLRTLGASRRMIMRTVMTEALLLGLIGTLLGLALGLALAMGLIAMMEGLGIPMSGLRLSLSAALVAAILGPVVTVIGVLRPARHAGRIEPIRAVLGGTAEGRSFSVWRLLSGIALYIPGLVFGAKFWFGGDNTGSLASGLLGIGMTMAMFLGMSLMAPWVITPIVRTLSRPLAGLAKTSGRMASDAARANPSRTAATAVALTIGLSVVVVNGALASSLLGTISDQIDAAYARDLTVQPIGQPLENGGGQTVPTAVQRRIAAMPGVAVATPVRSMFVDLPGIREGNAQGLAVAIDPHVYGRVDQSPVTGATRAEALAGMAAGGLIVNRSYARAANVRVGDSVTLRGGGGTQQARVSAVLETMGTFQGPAVQMSLATMRAVYGTTGDAQVVVKAHRSEDRAAIERRIGAIVEREYPNLELLSTAELKSQIEGDVNQQFAIFNAIVAIAVIVSLLGVINTLAISVIERTREIGVMRAIGSSRWQVRLAMVDESLLITVAGAIAGVGLGAIIGYAWVIGLRGIMPGIAFHFPATTAIAVAIAAVVLGVLAAILPARRAARLNIIDALNYE